MMNKAQKAKRNLRGKDAKWFRQHLGLWFMSIMTIHHKGKTCFVLSEHEHDLIHGKVPKGYSEAK